MSRILKAIKDNDLLDFNKAILYHQGLWPGASDPKGAASAFQWRAARRRWHGRLAFITPLFFIFVVYPATLIAYWGDFMVLVDVITYSFMLAGNISKLACVMLRGDKMRSLAAHLEELCRRTHAPCGANHAQLRANESELMAVRVRRLLKATVLLMSAWVLNVLLFLPEVYDKRVMVSSVYFPYDWRASPSYELTLTVWSITWAVCDVSVISIESLFIAILILLIGELRLLRIDIEHVVPPEDPDDDECIEVAGIDEDVKDEDDTMEGVDELVDAQDTTERQLQEDAERRLEECAIRFHECIRLTGEIQDAFQWMLSTQLVCNIVPGVFTVVWATTAVDLGQKAHVLVELAAVSWLHLLLYCYLGDQITEESALIREAVYDCSWLRESEGFKLSMRIMMSRSNQPVQITVANFVPLSRETFLEMANMAYSYYITLRDIVT